MSQQRRRFSVVVLAGGRGTRIADLYPRVPKPLIEVAGKPFLHWLTAYLARFGLRDFIYSTGYRSDQIAAWCENGEFEALTRRTCPEVGPLGTGGGLLNCLDLCGDAILVVNGDSLCVGGVDELLDLKGGVGLIGVHQRDASRYGSLEFSETDHRLLRLREKAPGEGYINAGVYVFPKVALKRFPRGIPMSIEREIVPTLIREGADIKVVPVRDAQFIDIGVPETVVAATSFVEANRTQF